MVIFMEMFDKVVDALTPKEAMTAMISYRTTPWLKKFLKQYAKEHGMTMQTLITDALKVYLEQEQRKMKADENRNEN